MQLILLNFHGKLSGTHAIFGLELLPDHDLRLAFVGI
jgi:hypothetical protein